MCEAAGCSPASVCERGCASSAGKGGSSLVPVPVGGGCASFEGDCRFCLDCVASPEVLSDG